jgi:hypothetical protein
MSADSNFIRGFINGLAIEVFFVACVILVTLIL